MTVATTNRKTAAITGNGSNTSWDFNFKVNKASELRLFRYNSITGVSSYPSTDDFDVTLASDLDSGTITYPNASSLDSTPSINETITVYREVAETQDTDIEKQQAFNSTVVEAALDKLTMRCQELQEQIDRCYKVGINFDDPSEIEIGLANPMTTEGDIIIGDAGGEPTRLGIGSFRDVLRTNSLGNPEWSSAFLEVQEVIASTATTEIDLDDGTLVVLTLETDTTLSFTNVSNPMNVRLTVKQDATGGHSLTFPSTWLWENGVKIEVSNGGNDITVYQLWNDEDTTFKINNVGSSYATV